MSHPTETIFSKIARGEIPATIVAESPRCLAFRDIAPQAPVHVVVIPKATVPTLNDADDSSLLGELLTLARDVAKREGLADTGYRVVINTGANGGQTVFHLHAHVLGGRAMTWPPG
jgi:histidine triad (HIT) family protein